VARKQDLTVSHRERLIADLRADRAFAADYLNACAEDDDPRVIVVALRNVAAANGLTKVAKAAGMSRKNLGRALSSVSRLCFSTFRAILQVAGLKIAVAPLQRSRTRPRND
jgi:probable addiction module antidote protein